MNRINIKTMEVDCIETLRHNPDKVTAYMMHNTENSNWLKEIYNGVLYNEKKYQIEDFELDIPKDTKDKEVDIKNSIILYNCLKDLPSYILTDEKFWNWINFEKAYTVALKNMPIKENSSVFKDHWLFTQGKRRGLFFGVLSRCYYRVALTIDESLEDPYEISRYAIKNPERFRTLAWRTYSGNRNIVRGCLKAAKYIDENYGDMEERWKFADVAKYISKLGSVMLIDAMPEEVIYNKIIAEYKKIVEIN